MSDTCEIFLMQGTRQAELLKGIWIDPASHWVSLILDFLASGTSIEEIIEEYPQLSREDIVACIAYGSEMARERFVDIPLETR